MSDDAQPKPIKVNSLTRRNTIYAGLLLVAFLLGFVPMWLKYREWSASLSEAEQQLSLARRQNALASAVIDARRGDYEPARQALLPYGQRPTEEMSRSSRKPNEKGYRRCLTNVMRSSLYWLVVILLP
jgi:hypothetical protein